MDIEYIRSNYRNFDDSKIEEIAKSEALQLRPEILPILIEEIRRRNLDEKLIEAIDVQLKPLNEEDIDAYCGIIQKMPCPICNSKTQRLNAIVLKEVVSIIIYTQGKELLKIACPDCLEVAKKNANFKTLTLGVWGIPHGIIKTIGALNSNSKMVKNIRVGVPNEILKSYVIQNMGQIELNKNDTNKLKMMLEKANRND